MNPKDNFRSVWASFTYPANYIQQAQYIVCACDQRLFLPTLIAIKFSNSFELNVWSAVEFHCQHLIFREVAANISASSTRKKTNKQNKQQTIGFDKIEIHYFIERTQVRL